MNDFNKKVGKAGLKGLLNKPEPEAPAPREDWPSSSWDKPSDWRRDGGGYGGGYGGGGSTYRSDYSQIGRPVGSANALGTIEGKHVVLSDVEVRNFKVSMHQIATNALKIKGLSVAIGNDGVFMDFFEQILTDGTVKYRHHDGKFYKPITEDDLYSEQVDDYYDNLDDIDL